MSTTRRQVLIAIAQLAAAATLASCGKAGDGGAAASAANPDLELLASVTYDILPFADVPPELYVHAARRILDLKDARVTAGMASLRAAAGPTAWKDLPDAQRVTILEMQQASPFFGVLRLNTLQVVLRDPATYAVIGYGGSTREFGGYIARGFNDISWLPKAAQPK